MCVQTTFLPCAPQTLRGFFSYQIHTLFTGCEPKYDDKFDESKRLTDEKRSSHADSSRRECLKKNNEQFTSSTSFSAFRSVYDTENHEADDYALGICWQVAFHAEDALYGPGGYGNGISRVESQEFSIRNRQE